MASSSNGIPQKDGKEPDPTDYANYFCTYSFLYHQKDMLEDHKRTGAYHRACVNNAQCFKGKVVLDVGTGSGILAIFAAKAGAKKVYAVEATSMAKFARQLVAHNKLESVVEVIQGTIETVELPEKVDIIISEWMGYFLLRESMLDSVIVARDKFLKPDGALYPSHARMFLVPIRSNQSLQRKSDFEKSLEGWTEFVEDMKENYQVDLGCLDPEYHKEQTDYFLHTAQWCDVHPEQMMGPPCCFKEYDLKTVTLEELKAPLRANFSLPVMSPGPIESLCGFFDTHFKGSKENLTYQEVILSTAPDATGATHWGQQAFHMFPRVMAQPGDRLVGSIELLRKKENHRLMQVNMEFKLEGSSPAAKSTPSRKVSWHIE